jgi:hypothetical protein
MYKSNKVLGSCEESGGIQSIFDMDHIAGIKNNQCIGKPTH